MNKNEKGASQVVGIALYVAAALFVIALLLGLMDGGSGSNPFSKFGAGLESAYGLCSVLIPAFLLVAGTFCFSSRWTSQKAIGLLVSVIPFFTLVLAERWSRSIAARDFTPIATIKIVSLVIIALLLVFAEYLVAFVIEAKFRDGTFTLFGKPAKTAGVADAVTVQDEDVPQDDAPHAEPEQAADSEPEAAPAQSTDGMADRISAFLKSLTPKKEEEPAEPEFDADIEAAVDEQLKAAASSAVTLRQLLSQEPQEAKPAVTSTEAPLAGQNATQSEPQDAAPQTAAAPATGQQAVVEEPVLEQDVAQAAGTTVQEPLAVTVSVTVSPQDAAKKEVVTVVQEPPAKAAAPDAQEAATAEPRLMDAAQQPAPVDAQLQDASAQPATTAQAPAAQPVPSAQAATVPNSAPVAHAEPLANAAAQPVTPERAATAPAQPQTVATQEPPLTQDAPQPESARQPQAATPAEPPLTPPQAATPAGTQRAAAHTAEPVLSQQAQAVSPAQPAAAPQPVTQPGHTDPTVAAATPPRATEPPLAQPQAAQAVTVMAQDDAEPPLDSAEEDYDARDEEADWDSFDMEDDEDDIIDSFEKANLQVQIEQEEAAIEVDDSAEPSLPVLSDEDETLPFDKAGVAQTPQNSGVPGRDIAQSHAMLSSLDTVFARMEADAKSGLESGEIAFNPHAEVMQSEQIKRNLVEIHPEVPKRPRHGEYKISTELLTAYADNPYWIIDDETNRAAELLKGTLGEFKIEAEITGIIKGPVVTMFELLPAPGVKLSKIVALQDNIALRLAASSVRIVAPIPGKRAVGIEIPNANRAIVSFRECIEQDIPEWKKMGVPVVLGKDIEGRMKVMDLVKTPHLLIAGSTGAGKSVCINNMILSILYKRNPNEVKMILIDPKIVELKLYNDIPHLLTPVITEPKRAMQALQYALCEMERRYALLDSLGVRDIASYNRRVSERSIATEKLPYLVIVIDEFADLMATTGKQLEGVLARLAAMSRAVGIHLVLATQRPSIDVITGLIKANIPSRIAFMVASKMDSRIIIDQVGAEKLLGKGDMLYASSTDPFPVRIQGAFVSDQEVENVVDAVKQWGEPEYIDDEIFVDDEDEDGGDQLSVFSGEGEDPLYDKALDIVMQAGKASASYIQRRLKIGYNRAARLVEEMEERGIVGPANGSKPRDIIHVP